MIPKHNDLTQEYLKSILRLDPASGIFTWTRNHNVHFVGRRAGTSKPPFNIKINGKLYRTHRLIYLYMTGEWPPDEIDHKNVDRTDNRWENLRPATRGQNQSNKLGTGKTGTKGVYLKKETGRYYAIITHNKNRMLLGCFDSQEEAAEAYNKKALEIKGEYANIGHRAPVARMQVATPRLGVRNKSGVTGVHWAKAQGKWEAAIYRGGKNHRLGLFDDIEKAKEARLHADQRLPKIHLKDRSC